MSDMEEFADLVGTKHNAYEADCEKAVNDVPLKSSEEPKVRHGRLTQYSHYGTAYLPTTTTTKALPAGAYRIIQEQPGLTLEPLDIVTDTLMRFPDTRSDEVMAEVESFWQLKDTFKKYGFSHKRGFLLWGPPGSGKTCTIAMVIHNMVNSGGIVIIAERPSQLAHMLPMVRMIESDRPIVVIWEDLDAVIDRYGESEVLAILDGESQVENIVFIATTNYPEKLDGRIVNRPSRFDKIVKIGMPNDEARAMYLMEKIGTTEIDGVDLVKATKDFSIAHLRELIVGIFCLDNKPLDVLERLSAMKRRPKSSDGDNIIGFGGREFTKS